MKVASRIALVSCWLAASHVEAAPPAARAPQGERRIAPQAERRVAPQTSSPARATPAAAAPARRAQQPENRVEALHYFRDRPELPGGTTSDADRGALEALIGERSEQARARRSEAMALLDRFVAEAPEDARELPDALLRLSELTWEVAREEYLTAFAAHQKLPEKNRGAAPTPEYARTLALYDRLIGKHPDFARLDLVLYMKAVVLLEQGDERAGLPLFQRILADFPTSRFRPDAHMALAEHIFNDEYDYPKALAEYDRVLAYEDSPLYDLALFKSAWCLWQLDRKGEAAVRFRKVLDIGGEAEGTQRKHLKELQADALESLIQVFTEDEKNRAADVRRFLQEVGGEHHLERVLVKLSGTYYDQGRFDRGIEAYQLLLELDPADAHAPAYQLALARGYMATDRFPKALEAYRTLATTYTASSTWATQQGDPDAGVEAEQLAEQALREQALSLHELGQRSGEKAPLEQAVALYGVYLAAFPKAEDSYRLAFYRAEILFHRLKRYPEAGEAYLVAAQMRPDGELTKDALYNAVSCFERVREQEVKQCTSSAPCPETDNDRRFSRAIELYASYFPNDPDLPEILFRQGKLYYDRHVYDPAVRLFGELLERFPNSPYAADAGELVLDSFNRAADYENIERWSRKLKTAPSFRSPEAQKRLDGLILGAVFKSGEQLAEKGEHARAADAYLRAAREFPRDPRAPKAYYNAGLELSRTGSLEGADKTYSELIDKYPGTKEGALGALAGAEMYASIAQFGDAARFYGAYAERFPNEERAEAAAYNAVLLRASEGDHKATIAASKRYLARYPRGESAAEVTFRLGRAQQASGDKREAAATYRAFIAHAKGGPSRIEANTRLGKLLLETGDRKGADAALTAAVKEGARDKAKTSRAFAAEARFLQGDEALREFDAVRIEGSPRELSNRLKQKSELLAQAAGIYGDVVAYGVAEWVTAALYKVGESYEHFAKALNDAPVPEGLNEREAQIYRDELARFVVPIEERALSAYEGGYKKARELGIYNRWTTAMREALTRLNDVSYPKLNELGGERMREVTLAGPPVIEGRRRSGEPAK